MSGHTNTPIGAVTLPRRVSGQLAPPAAATQPIPEAGSRSAALASALGVGVRIAEGALERQEILNKEELAKEQKIINLQTDIEGVKSSVIIADKIKQAVKTSSNPFVTMQEILSAELQGLDDNNPQHLRFKKQVMGKVFFSTGEAVRTRRNQLKRQFDSNVIAGTKQDLQITIKELIDANPNTPIPTEATQILHNQAFEKIQETDLNANAEMEKTKDILFDEFIKEGRFEDAENLEKILRKDGTQAFFLTPRQTTQIQAFRLNKRKVKFQRDMADFNFIVGEDPDAVLKRTRFPTIEAAVTGIREEFGDQLFTTTISRRLVSDYRKALKEWPDTERALLAAEGEINPSTDLTSDQQEKYNDIVYDNFTFDQQMDAFGQGYNGGPAQPAFAKRLRSEVTKPSGQKTLEKLAAMAEAGRRQEIMALLGNRNGRSRENFDAFMFLRENAKITGVEFNFQAFINLPDNKIISIQRAQSIWPTEELQKFIDNHLDNARFSPDAVDTLRNHLRLKSSLQNDGRPLPLTAEAIDPQILTHGMKVLPGIGIFLTPSILPAVLGNLTYKNVLPESWVGPDTYTGADDDAAFKDTNKTSTQFRPERDAPAFRAFVDELNKSGKLKFTIPSEAIIIPVYYPGADGYGAELILESGERQIINYLNKSGTYTTPLFFTIPSKRRLQQEAEKFIKATGIKTDKSGREILGAQFIKNTMNSLGLPVNSINNDIFELRVEAAEVEHIAATGKQFTPKQKATNAKEIAKELLEDNVPQEDALLDYLDSIRRLNPKGFTFDRATGAIDSDFQQRFSSVTELSANSVSGALTFFSDMAANWSRVKEPDEDPADEINPFVEIQNNLSRYEKLLQFVDPLPFMEDVKTKSQFDAAMAKMQRKAFNMIVASEASGWMNFGAILSDPLLIFAGGRFLVRAPGSFKKAISVELARETGALGMGSTFHQLNDPEKTIDDFITDVGVGVAVIGGIGFAGRTTRTILKSRKSWLSGGVNANKSSFKNADEFAEQTVKEGSVFSDLENGRVPAWEKATKVKKLIIGGKAFILEKGLGKVRENLKAFREAAK